MGEIKIGRMVLGVCQTNCYFLYREDSKECIFVDPADQGVNIYKAMTKNGFKIAAVLLTHGHFDHIWGTKELCELSGAKLYALDVEKEVLQDAHKNVSSQVGRAYTTDADIYLKDGDEMTIADMTFQVIATPGHTAGGCCYYFKEAGFLVSGDTLFRDSVGRTDFPTGSMGTLVRSIKEKLFVLPDETKVYPGHGDNTTIGHEKIYNPFCQ
ncbi:MAG: MBL fold metallo-hydrolase [Lachnospiraceae bacterium]|nr:MBL fold metallo-hydrolase [Lachnospiraceae bacterium]